MQPRTESSLMRFLRSAYPRPKVVQYLQQKKQRSSQRAWISGTGSSFLRTWRTGYADCINDDDIEEFIGIINTSHRIIRSLLINTLWVKKSRLMQYVMVGYPDSWYHGAYRACRNPFRRQYFRISGTDLSAKSKRDSCRVYKRLARHFMLSV